MTDRTKRGEGAVPPGFEGPGGLEAAVAEDDHSSAHWVIHRFASQINSRANQLAHYLLHTHKVRIEEAIALFMERSAELIVTWLAVLKSGGQYVPLDPHVNAMDRHAFVIRDCACSVLLTGPQHVARVQSLCTHVIGIDLDDWAFAKEPTTNPNVALVPENACYTIYTSGTTGVSSVCRCPRGPPPPVTLL